MLTFKQFKDLGISTFPTHNYKPVVTWSKYRTEMPTDEECVEWESKGYDVGVVTGELSGNLYCIDVDEKYNLVGKDKLIARWSKEVSTVNEELLSKLVVAQTRSAGWHVYFRTEQAVGGNEKFASRFPTEAELKDEPHLKTKVLLESRGEGGMCFQHNMPLKNSWDKLPVLTESEVDILITSAKILNEVHVERKESTYTAPKASVGGITPLDDYDASNDGSVCLELLLEHGWSVVNETAEGWRLARPGKTHGISATLDIIPDRFYVFSSSTEFDVEAPYKYSAVYAMLEHGGDFSAATKELAKEGYGEQLNKEERVDLLNKMMGKSDDVELASEEEQAILAQITNSRQDMDKYLAYVKTKREFRLSDQFIELSKLMKDIQPSHYVAWAAASGVGKTSTIRQVINDYLNTSNQVGIFASLEMPSRDLALRNAMECSDPHDGNYVDKDEVTKDLVSNDVFREQVVSDWDNFYTITTAYDVDVIMNMAKVFIGYMRKQGKEVGCVVLDFVQLANGGHNIDKQPEIAQKLKMWAKKLDVIVIGLLQMNSQIDKFTEPTENNISGHKALFQTADHGFLLWKNAADTTRIAFKSAKERWSLEGKCDLVQRGMKVRSEPYMEVSAESKAARYGNKSI